jgi:biotin transport system substrate-specific component
VLLVALFALLTALGAHLAVPLPFGPVPLSMQTLFVLLSGLLLGAGPGAAAQAAYVAAGIAGIPVFAHGFGGPGVLLGPTGGYLLAFPVAAAIAGWAAERARGRSLASSVLVLAAGAILASATILGGGWGYLTLLGGDPARALTVGVLPFLAGDAAKVVLAVVLAAGLKPRFRQLL